MNKKSILKFFTSNILKPLFIKVENEFLTSNSNIDNMDFFLENDIIEVVDKCDVEFTILNISLDSIKNVESTEKDITIEYVNNSKIYVLAFEK